jgi:hypothetical protein
MNKKKSFHFWHVLLVNVAAFVLAGCMMATAAGTPTSDWQPVPTYSYYIPPSDVTEYTHYVSKTFEIYFEFDYPSYWWLEEWVNDVGAPPTLLLRDPRYLTLPTPLGNEVHSVPNDFGYIYIVPVGEPGETPESWVESLKQANSKTPRTKTLGDYRIKVDGYGASVLEYQADDPETSPSLMFFRIVCFIVKGQVYEIVYSVAEKDRSGEFDKGYEHFLNSLKIVP